LTSSLKEFSKKLGRPGTEPDTILVLHRFEPDLSVAKAMVSEAHCSVDGRANPRNIDRGFNQRANDGLCANDVTVFKQEDDCLEELCGPHQRERCNLLRQTDLHPYWVPLQVPTKEGQHRSKCFKEDIGPGATLCITSRSPLLSPHLATSSSPYQGRSFHSCSVERLPRPAKRRDRNEPKFPPDKRFNLEPNARRVQQVAFLAQVNQDNGAADYDDLEQCSIGTQSGSQWRPFTGVPNVGRLRGRTKPKSLARAG
jgi:hypothetical protein